MDTTGDYQIVVTYRDANGVWKVRAVEGEDVTAGAVHAGESDVDCFVPDFWGSVPRSAHIEHVAVHVDFGAGAGGVARGRTFYLAWPPPKPGETPRPALAMHMRLRYAADDTPTSADWNPAAG